MKKGMLTRKQREYIRYYVLLRSQREAGLKAGYSPKGVSAHCSRIMNNPAVIAEISRLMDEKYNITREEYEKRTLDLHNNETHNTTKAKYWELLGKVKGFIKDIQNVQVTTYQQTYDSLFNRSKVEAKVDAPVIPSVYIEEDKGSK